MYYQYFELLFALPTARLCFQRKAVSMSYKEILTQSFRRTLCLQLPTTTGRTARLDIPSWPLPSISFHPMFLLRSGSGPQQSMVKHNMHMQWQLAHMYVYAQIRCHCKLGAFDMRFITNVVLLVQVWVVNDMVREEEQRWAPPGTCFHHFGVFPLSTTRRSDCTYEYIPAMRLPSNARTMNGCEVLINKAMNKINMDRVN